MTQTRELTGISNSVDITVRYREFERHSFASLIRQIQDLRALVGVAHVMLPGADWKGSTYDAEKSTEVARFNYNSPVEVLLTISAGAGGAIAIVNRILATYARFQEVRLQKSNVNVSVLANEAIMDELRARREDRPKIAVDIANQSLIHDAAQALEAIDAIELGVDGDGHR